MKTERVFLCEWLGDYTDSYNDIPWPMVHEWVGHEAVRWLNSHPWEQVQLILEKETAPMTAGIQRLYAEFYVPALRSEFALRFAK
jgi:hypothetical protein